MFCIFILVFPVRVEKNLCLSPTLSNNPSYYLTDLNGPHRTFAFIQGNQPACPSGPMIASSIGPKRSEPNVVGFGFGCFSFNWGVTSSVSSSTPPVNVSLRKHSAELICSLSTSFANTLDFYGIRCHKLSNTSIEQFYLHVTTI